MRKSQEPDYDGPDEEKYKPLDKTPTQRLIEQAMEIGKTDPLSEVCVRGPLSTGVRNDELVHSIDKYIDERYSDEHEEVRWYIRIPPFEECTGGKKNAGKKNTQGANLHEKGDPCNRCRDRNTEDKDWLSDRQKAQDAFSPKNRNSIEKFQWFLKGRDELAKKWKSVCRSAGGQFPITHGRVNARIRQVAREAGLDDVRSEDPETGKLNITCHALRHTYGCKLGAQPNWNPTQVMSYMRHGNLDMALWYSDQWGERRRAVMDDYEDKYSD